MKAIVLGGSGALGKAVVSSLKKKNIAPICIDLVKNVQAADNLLIKPDKNLADQCSTIMSDLGKMLGNDGVSGVYCTAGGWAGGTIQDPDFLKVMRQMYSMNLETAGLASHIAYNYLSDNGLLLLTGANAALSATPTMVGYSLSKCSTHYLVQTIAADPVFANKNSCAVGILPVVIDTPMNRKSMPKADYSSWTSPDEIATTSTGWLTDTKLRPPSGSILSIHTEKDETAYFSMNVQPAWSYSKQTGVKRSNESEVMNMVRQMEKEKKKN